MHGLEVKWPCNPLVGNVKNNGPEMLDAPMRSSAVK